MGLYRDQVGHLKDGKRHEGERTYLKIAEVDASFQERKAELNGKKNGETELKRDRVENKQFWGEVIMGKDKKLNH